MEAKKRKEECSMLTRALLIAAAAHDEQKDKGGEPYILHPLRLMLQLDTEEERVLALLHDVVEDSPWTLEALKREGFSEAVLAALDCLSKREGEAYPDFISRILENEAARRIKLLDLRDNMDTSRLGECTAETAQRLEKYQKAEQRILEAMQAAKRSC